MPAPRLQEKRQIQASLAQERKQQIDEGKKLVDSILQLREAKEREGRELEEMRANALAVIARETAVKQAENDALARDNVRLKEERIRLEAPLDLQEAWEEVKGEKAKSAALSEHLLTREIEVSRRENDLADALAALSERDAAVGKAETEASEHLRVADAERQETTEANQEAQTLLAATRQRAKNSEALHLKRSRELDQREAALTEREEELAKEQLSITNEKILLADRRATLERGFEELRRKQYGTGR
jgi:hypothetical protein